MKPKFLHKILTAVSALSLSLLPACSSDKEEVTIIDDSPTFMSFSFSFDKTDLPTRADGDDDWSDIKPNDPDYEEGIDFDNYIDQVSFRPVIYKVVTQNGQEKLEKFVDVTPLTLIDESDGLSTKKTFSFTGMFPADPDNGITHDALAGTTQEYRLMIFTNIDLTGDPAIDENLSFSLIGNQGKPGFRSIPMWGVRSFTFQNLRKDQALLIDEVPLLRAMAMVRVMLAPEAEFDPYKKGAPRDEVDLVSVRINRSNSSGMVAPNMWDQLKYTNQSSHLFASTLRVPSTASIAPYKIAVGEKDEDADDEEEDTKVRMEVDATDGTEIYFNHPYVNREILTFYLPEIANSANESEKLYLSIGFRTYGGPIQYCHFEVKNYKTDETWDIIRNHIYEYVVTSVQDAKIAVETKVNDWQYHKAPPQDLER